MLNEELLLLEDVCPILHIGKTTAYGLIGCPHGKSAENDKSEPMILKNIWRKNSVRNK